MNGTFDRIDSQITSWMARHGVMLLRISLGVIFFWFGVLKLFPGLSPAEGLAGDTILQLSGEAIGPEVSVPILGAWEALIGLGLLLGRALRFTLLLLFLQMPGTITPVFLFPDRVFQSIPFVLTIEGQYIVKNLVLVSAALVIGATVRGGFLSSRSVERSASPSQVEAG